MSYLLNLLHRVGPETAAAVAALAGLLLWRLGARSPPLAAIRWWLFAAAAAVFGAAQAWQVLSATRPSHLAEQLDWVPIAAALVVGSCLITALWRVRPPPTAVWQSMRARLTAPATRHAIVAALVVVGGAVALALLSAAALAPPRGPGVNQGVLWVGTGGGLSGLSARGWRGFGFIPGSGGMNRVTALAVDSRTGIVLGMARGLAISSGRDWWWLDRQNSALPGGNILALAVDHEGVLWAAGEFGVAGLKPRGGSAAFTQRNAPLLHSVVDAIYVDSRNWKWFGSAGGVNIYAGGLPQPLGGGAPSGVPAGGPPSAGARTAGGWVRGFNSWNSGLPADLVFTITQDRRGRTWFGTLRGAAVMEADEATWTVYRQADSGLPHDKVHAILVDTRDRVWFGTEGGLAVLDGERWSAVLPLPGTLDHPWVQALSEDGQGRIWAGTRGGGLSVFDGGGWRVVRASRLHVLTGWVVRSHWSRTLIHDDVLALEWTR